MTTIACADEGNGTALLCIHAFPLDGRMWQPQVDALKDDVRVLAPDLRGFGRSRNLGTVRTLEGHAEDLRALLDAKGIDRAMVMGLSMGGYIALTFARMFTDRVASLILADTKATPDTPEARAGRDKSVAVVKGAGGVGELLEGLLPRLLAKHAPTALSDHVRNLALAQEPAAVADALVAMRDRPDNTAILGKLDVPVLAIVGEHDVVTPIDDAHRMADAARDAEIVVIPGAGHLANLEQLDLFNDALRAFISRVAPVPASTGRIS